jgi:hypothetical protein
MTIPSSDRRGMLYSFRVAVFCVIEVVLYREYEMPPVLETRPVRLIQPYQFHVVTRKTDKPAVIVASVGLLSRTSMRRPTIAVSWQETLVLYRTRPVVSGR